VPTFALQGTNALYENTTTMNLHKVKKMLNGGGKKIMRFMETRGWERDKVMNIFTANDDLGAVDPATIRKVMRKGKTGPKRR
jgi:hypothetical protein